MSYCQAWEGGSARSTKPASCSGYNYGVAFEGERHWKVVVVGEKDLHFPDEWQIHVI